MGIRNLKEKFQSERAMKGMTTLSKESLKWFFNFTKKHVTSANFSKVKGQGNAVNRVYPGRLYVYQYDPKHKDTLPFYDTLPLVLVTSVNKDGWTGINFHYMPPLIRFKIMQAFLDTLTSDKLSAQRKLTINWAKAERLAAGVSADKALNRSIKRYLAGHVASQLIEVQPENWEMCLFLPLSKFKKSSAKTVWKS